MLVELKVSTQYMENYGFAEDRDYWKCKGGDEYTVAVMELEKALELEIAGLVDRVAVEEAIKQEIEYSNPASLEYVLASYFEKDGQIVSPIQLENKLNQEQEAWYQFEIRG